jgi:hypothetical protein
LTKRSSCSAYDGIYSKGAKRPAHMLASNDELDAIGENGSASCGRLFAAMIGTFTDGLPEPLVHHFMKAIILSNISMPCIMYMYIL